MIDRYSATAMARRNSQTFFGKAKVLSFRGGLPGLAFAAGALLVLFVGLGAVGTQLFNSRAEPLLDHKTLAAEAPDGADGDVVAYLRAPQQPVTGASAAAGGPLLPDVSTMTERLAARMEATPGDVKGWKTLGWSYFHTGLHDKAAAAYAKALALDPNSAELKIAYNEAKSKISTSGGPATLQAEADGKSAGSEHGTIIAKSDAALPRDHTSEIRSMVDGLAHRLDASPHDLDGWARLMRSRVVMGDTELALATYRKALGIFKDDAAASGRMKATALELGLKAE